MRFTLNLHLFKNWNIGCFRLIAGLACFLIILGVSSYAFADVDVDIRVSGVLFNGQKKVAYVAVVNDCTDVVSCTIQKLIQGKCDLPNYGHTFCRISHRTI